MTTTRLGYTLDGPEEAPVLVMSPSLGTTRDMWLPQVPHLSQGWRLVRVDHPGHGASPIWDGQVTVEDIGRAVIGLLDELGYRRVSFCGLSLGGAIGQWIAAHRPERIERLVLCCTAAHFAPEVFIQRAATVRAQGMAAVSEAVVDRWFTPRFRAEQPEVYAHYRAMLESIPAEGYAACCEAVGSFDSRSYLSAVTAPTLLIAGREDPATTVAKSEEIRTGIPGARLEIVEAAHLANVEQPDAVTDAIVAHLRGAGQESE